MIKRWLQNTIPNSTVEGITVLHLGGNWNDHTRVCLTHLFDKILLNGVIQINDYGHQTGTRKHFMTKGTLELTKSA